MALPDGKKDFAKPIVDNFKERGVNVENGFDPLEAEVMDYYGWRPATILAWHYTTRVIAVCLMAYFLSQNAASILQDMLPPDQRDDTKLGALFVDVTQYWTHLVTTDFGLKSQDTNQIVKANVSVKEIGKEVHTIPDPMDAPDMQIPPDTDGSAP